MDKTCSNILLNRIHQYHHAYSYTFFLIENTSTEVRQGKEKRVNIELDVHVFIVRKSHLLSRHVVIITVLIIPAHAL